MTFVRLLVPARSALVCLFALLGPTNAWAAGVVQTLGEAESEKVKKCINQFGQPVPCPPEDITPGNCALPAGCNTQDPTTYGICTSGVMTFCRCANMPDMKVVVADDGRASCVPTKACRSHSAGAPNSLGMNDQTCRRFPISPKNSIDPNDKVGTLGAADPGFVPGTTPLNYAVHFENLSTATGS